MLRAEFFDLDDDLPAEVISILRSMESRGFEQGLDWYQNINDTVFRSDGSLMFAVCFDDIDVLAVFPFRIKRNGAICSLESPCNFYTPLYAPFFHEKFDSSTFAFLVDKINKHVCRFSRVAIFPLDPSSREFRIIAEGLSFTCYVPFSFFCFGNWFMPVTSNWQEYLAQREGVLRATIRRKGKEFLARGGYYEIIDGDDRLEYALQAYLTVYKASWKVPEPFENFIPGFVKMLASKGWLRLGVATLDEKPIAVQLWIVANGKASIFKLAYDEDYKKYSAGTLLSAVLMQHVIDKDNVFSVDYLIGDDPYKSSWMTFRRERWGIVAYNRNTIFGVFCLCRELIGRLLKYLIGRRW